MPFRDLTMLKSRKSTIKGGTKTASWLQTIQDGLLQSTRQRGMQPRTSLNHLWRVMARTNNVITRRHSRLKTCQPFNCIASAVLR